MSTWISIAATVVSGVTGVFIGGRLQLARQRWAELRRTLDRAQNGKALEGAFITTHQQRQIAERNGLVHHVRVINAIQFVLLWNWDLTLLLHALGADRETWSLDAGFRKKLNARMLALTIFESLTKLERLLDEKSDRTWSVWRAARALGVADEARPHLEAARQGLQPLLDENRDLLKGIRDNVAGHRDQNVAQQMEWMRRADSVAIENLGWKLLAATNTVLGSLTELVVILKKNPREQA